MSEHYSSTLPEGGEALRTLTAKLLIVEDGSGGGGGGTSGGTYTGTGSPEGIVAAPVGSIYTDTTDPNAPSVWTKSSGGSTANGWSQVIA